MEPTEKRRLSASSRESRTVESVIRPMAAQSRLLMRSLKISSAMSEVATI